MPYNIRYNIYLSSPQLAVEANRKKYYQYIINRQQNIIDHNKFGNYKPIYYQTGYNKIYYPQVSISYP
jgi:hypothetical protein